MLALNVSNIVLLLLNWTKTASNGFNSTEPKKGYPYELQLKQRCNIAQSWKKLVKLAETEQWTPYRALSLKPRFSVKINGVM